MRTNKKKKSVFSAEEEQYFSQLKEVFSHMGIDVRQEKGNFRGGMCIVEGERKILFVNKRHSAEGRISTMLTTLRRMREEGIDLPPEAEPFIVAVKKEL